MKRQCGPHKYKGFKNSLLTKKPNNIMLLYFKINIKSIQMIILILL